MHDHLMVLHVGLFLAERSPPPPQFSDTHEHRLLQEYLEHNLKTAADRKNMLLVVRHETLISQMKWNNAMQNQHRRTKHAHHL
jgi:hypothetical protein